jgi:O-succinylbenzoate synthase
MVESAIELVDGVRAERVADLGAIEGVADRSLLDVAVVRHISEVEAVDRPPYRGIEEFGDRFAHAARIWRGRRTLTLPCNSEVRRCGATRRRGGPTIQLGSDYAVFAIPLRARFRGITVREGMLIRGPAGWGEFSPFWDYSPAACGPWLSAALEAACEGWPPPVRDRVPVNVTVPAVGTIEAAAIVRASGGCRTAKVKVAEAGQSVDEDVERIEAVRDALGGAGRIRVDANGAWDVGAAVAMIRRLEVAAGGLEYVEQPCRSLDELTAVRRRVDVPIAADESIRRSADPHRVDLADAADVAVLKVQPLGGVRACLQIAEQCGLPVVVSSALETSVGIAAGVALAAALPELPYACGLATVQLLADDVVADSLLPVDGFVSVRRVEPDPARMDAVRADEATAERWDDRLRAAIP